MSYESKTREPKGEPISMTDVPIDADALAERVLVRVLARIEQQAVKPTAQAQPPARTARKRTDVSVPDRAPDWQGDVPAATVSLNTVHVELWAAADQWRCSADGTGQGSGCLHVGMARERASERRESDGQLHQETSWTDFTCRAAITLSTRRFIVKPKKRKHYEEIA